jgi:hypothetical protein
MFAQSVVNNDYDLFGYKSRYEGLGVLFTPRTMNNGMPQEEDGVVGEEEK